MMAVAFERRKLLVVMMVVEAGEIILMLKMMVVMVMIKARVPTKSRRRTSVSLMEEWRGRQTPARGKVRGRSM